MNEFSNDTFQVINMNYKLKRIKNKKQREKNNYKNIQPLKTLDNTLNPEPSGLEPFNTINMKKDVVEGFKDSDYDGLDNVNDLRDKAAASDPREKLIELINKLYDGANKINRIIASRIVRAITNNNPSDLQLSNDLNSKLQIAVDQHGGAKAVNSLTKGNQDAFWNKVAQTFNANTGSGLNGTKCSGQWAILNNTDVIRHNMVWTEAALLSCFVSYNLFFIMFYKDVENIKLFEITTDGAKEAALSMPFLYFLLFFFEYSIFFPEMLNKLLTSVVPNITKNLFNATLIFAVLFISLIFFFKYLGVKFKDFLINGIRGKLGWVGKVLMGIIAILWISQVLKDGKDKFLDTPLKTGIPASNLDKVLFLINRILRGIAALIFGVPMGILLMILYIIGYVFLAVFIYKGADIKIYKRMDAYIRGAKSEHIFGICENPSIFDYVYEYSGIKLIMQFVDHFHDFIYPVAFMIIFIYGMIEYLKPGVIQGEDQLKSALAGINGSFIFLLGMFVLNKIKNMMSKSAIPTGS
jgi:hypothetical protein